MIKHQAVLTLAVTFNKTIMSNVNLVEHSVRYSNGFWTKKFIKNFTEIKKDRALSMSFDNNLLTEVKGIEYVVGLGIDLRMWFSVQIGR
jgi:hypothetical protein